MSAPSNIRQNCLPAAALALLSAALIVAFTPGPSPAATPDKLESLPGLDAALRQHAPLILARLQKDHAADLQKNRRLGVGVLKFLVQAGTATADDNAGPLNDRMAERLEVALILSLKDQRVRLLRNASATIVKETNRRANHRDPENTRALKAFFDNEYPPAWGGEEKLPADVFLTGLVKIDDCRRNATVTVQSFGRSGKMQDVCTFKSRVEARTLTEAGVSYVRSRNADVDELEAARPEVVEKELPIQFEVLYDNKPVEIKNGVVPPPRPGQEVTFRLRHRNKDDITYGVVLKVNGENTLFRNDKSGDDRETWKWIVKPKKTTQVTGYQSSLKEYQAFKVAPVQSSDASKVRYNEHAGTFQVVVYRAQLPTDKLLVKAKEHRDTLYIGRGFPKLSGKEESLVHLQNLLKNKRDNTRATTRGFIEPGDRTKGRVEEVDFKPFGEPSSLTVRYYSPDKD